MFATPFFSASGTSIRRAQRGVTLIEVLVSMLIMALALVSMAALQSNTLKYQYGSSQRAVLSVLLADFSERVRANLGTSASATYPYLHQAELTDFSAALPVASADCAKAVCDAANLATYDMAQWRQAVRRELPNGTVSVAGSPTTGLTVSFMWSDKEFNGFVQTVFGARTSAVCAAAQTGMDQQACCPLVVPAGIRCATFTVMP
jgi:type IV pilus assembly protein PilV